MSELKRNNEWSWQQSYLEQLRRAEKAEALNRSLIMFMKAAVSHSLMGKAWKPEEILSKGLELGLLSEKDKDVYNYANSIKNVAKDL